MRRVSLAVFGLLIAVMPASALGEYRGSDIWGNVVDGAPIIKATHPLGSYSLDSYVDTGITSMDQFPAAMMQGLAGIVWTGTRSMVWGVLSLLDWAFRTDLVTGLLAAIGPAMGNLNQQLGSLLVPALLLGGMLLTWRGLLQRQYAQALTAAAISIMLMVATTWVASKPQDSVGWLNQQVNQASVGLLGEGTTEKLFGALVEKPWAALEFGGLRHCSDWSVKDSDGFPMPVGPHGGTVCRDVLRANSGGTGDYAARFLKYPSSTQARKQAYESMKDGSPNSDWRPFDEAFPGWHVDKADAGAADAMQAGGAGDRFVLAVVFFVCALGAVLFLGWLAVGMLIAGVMAVFLVVAAPLMYIASAVAGWGHTFTLGWLKKLGGLLVIKFVFALAVTCSAAVFDGLLSPRSGLSPFLGFMAVGLASWALFLKRAALLAVAPGGASAQAVYQAPRRAMVTGAAAVAAPVAAVHHHREKQERKEEHREMHETRVDMYTAQREAAQAQAEHYRKQENAGQEDVAMVERRHDGPLAEAFEERQNGQADLSPRFSEAVKRQDEERTPIGQADLSPEFSHAVTAADVERTRREMEQRDERSDPLPR